MAGRRVTLAPEMLPQAERAVRAFQKLSPTLDAFAQALTGRDIQVRLGDITQTDGKTIYLMPPFELGNEVEHDRSVCDDRDELDKLICPACDIREFILILIYHEISHLAFGSFADISIAQFVRTIGMTNLTPEIKNRVSEKIRREAAKMSKPGVQDMGAKVNRFVPSMMNALEDVRVDCRMVDARPGTGVMHRSLKLRTLSGGYKRLDGEVIDWSKLDANAQFTIATMALADGIDPSPFLDPAVMAVFEDERIMALVNAASGTFTVAEASALAVETVIEAQRYGLFMSDNPDENYQEVPDDEDTEPEDADEEDGELDGEGKAPEGSTEPEGDGEVDEGAYDPADEDADTGGGNVEEPTRDGDSDGDSDGDDVDAPSPEAGDAGEDDTESSEPADEPDGEGEPDAGDDGGESGDTDEAADEPSSGSSTSGSGQTGGDSTSDTPGDGDSEPSERGEADFSDSAGASETDDRGEGAVDFDGEGEAPEDSDLGHSERDERLIRNALKELGFGDHHDVERALREVIGHDEKLHEVSEDPRVRAIEEKAIETAATYIEHFDAPSKYLGKVNTVRDVRHFPIADRSMWYASESKVETLVGESILGPSLLRLRRALADNQRSAKTPNKRSGRVNGRVLGRRAWSDDDRLFTKKTTPGKKDYAVLIGVDCSGSTHGEEIDIEKEAAYAQAELCHRLGIKFAVYGHSGQGGSLLIYEVKSFDAPWNPESLKKLNMLGPVAMNLDGHTLQYYRKRLDEVRAMHKILMYYTDGQMPAENRDEELPLLRAEIKACHKQGHILMAVAVGCDDPKKYGMDTVRIDETSDVPKVVTHLGKRIMDL